MSLLLAPIYDLGAPAPGVVAFLDASVFGPYRAHFMLANDGFAYVGSGTGNGVSGGAWIDPQSGMNLYECMATNTLGTLTTGTFGAWLDLAQSWSWGISTSYYGYGKDSSFTVQIRRKSDLVVVATFNVDLSIEGNSRL